MGYEWKYLKQLRYSQAYIERYKVKLQGSTYDTVFVDLNDMIYDKNGNIYPNADDLLRRLYVACSRASHNLILGYGRQGQNNYKTIT